MDLFFLFAVTEIKLEEVIKTVIVSLVFLVCSSLVLSLLFLKLVLRRHTENFSCSGEANTAEGLLTGKFQFNA